MVVVSRKPWIKQGRWRARMLRIAARHADIVGLTYLITPDSELPTLAAVIAGS